MRAMLITTSGKAEVLQVENTLHELYALLGVSCIEILPLGKGLHAIVDEEGLLKQDPVLTVVRGTSYFVGNVLITGTDSDGDCGDLTDEQVEYLAKRLVTVDGVTILNLPWRCQ